MKKAIFLDRDGTINHETNYLIDFRDFKLIDGVLQALKIFQKLGFELFITSNQSGVARGYFSTTQVEFLNNQITNSLAKQGIKILETVFCPHYEKGKVPEYAIACNCRKPKPGMILYLQQKYQLDLKSSYTVGDKLRDAQAGQAAGVPGILVKTGHSLSQEEQTLFPCFDSLFDFAAFLTPKDASLG